MIDALRDLGHHGADGRDGEADVTLVAAKVDGAVEIIDSQTK